jgi:hypothetical protein
MMVLVTSKCHVHTLLRQSLLLVLLESLIAILSLDRSIRPRLCKIQVHLPPEQIESLEVVDGVLRAVHIVVDDEGLALALETLFRDDVDNGAELVEEAVQGFDQGRDLDGLVEVADVYPFSMWLVFDPGPRAGSYGVRCTNVALGAISPSSAMVAMCLPACC